MSSGIFSLNEINEVEMQSEEDNDELEMDKIEELLNSRVKNARWSDEIQDVIDKDKNSEDKKNSSKKRPRVESETEHDKEEHKKKKSRWDIINESEGGVVKMTGTDMTVSIIYLAKLGLNIDPFLESARCICRT